MTDTASPLTTSEHTSGIVVGIDGSDGAGRALRWAVDEGGHRGWVVTALLAWTYLDQHHAGHEQRFDAEYGADDARGALDGYVAGAVGDDAAAVRRLVVCDHPASALIDASRGAQLLVVGARGLGGVRGALLGSVSSACLHHATCPVAVVRDVSEVPVAPRARARVVVGVDESDTARRALAWAAADARARGAVLEVVHAWSLPVTTVHPLVPASFPIDAAAMEDVARGVLAGAIAAAGIRDQPVEQLLVEGPTARSILDVAEGADVLVVGSRGRGGFAGLLLGSVSTQLTHHGPCPVVVVPPADRTS